MFFQPTPHLAQFLCSAQAAEWLNLAKTLPFTPKTLLQDIQTLRRLSQAKVTLSADQAAAIVEQTLLRRRAREKFSQAEQMLFVREALEQATRQEVAHHRAKRFQGFERIADLGCGIGGDSLALAQVAHLVWAYDLDEIRLIFAQHNAAVYNLAAKINFVRANVLQLPCRLDHLHAMFIDPARRTKTGKRVYATDQYQPPLEQILGLYANKPLAIKIAPGVDWTKYQIDEVEIISFAGEAKEMIFWQVELATSAVKRRATLLPSGETVTDTEPDDCPLVSLGDYIYEPDPAIIRAGLVAQTGLRLGLGQLDPHIAYLSGPSLIQSSLVTGYAIQAVLPLKIKKINHYLKSHGLGRANVKQRGTGLSPEKIQTQLKTAKDGPEFTLILSRFQDRHLALVCFKVVNIKA